VAIHEVKQFLHEAGLPALRFHDLRHSSATIPISMGVNSKVVLKLLGHSTISITLGVYGHVTESMQCDAMQTLDEAFPALRRKCGGKWPLGVFLTKRQRVL
jgi:integrase